MTSFNGKQIGGRVLNIKEAYFYHDSSEVILWLENGTFISVPIKATTAISGNGVEGSGLRISMKGRNGKYQVDGGEAIV